MSPPSTVVRSGPLTWVQQWHWFERTIPEPRRVNPTPLADHCHIPQSATVADVHAALASLTDRHEAMRTTVDPVHPVQHVHRADWAPLPVDHVHVPVVDADTLAAATAALAACPIDPEKDPPWRARVLLEAGKPRAVLIAAHHLVIDGWGLGVLINQLHDRLRGADEPPRAVTHPLDMIATQHPGRADAAERDWIARLTSNPTGVLNPFGGNDNGTGRHRVQHRSADACDDVDRVARRYRVSPEIVVLAVLAHDVATRTGEHRFLASVVVSNRARAALRASVGVCALTVPVQIDLRPGAVFGEVVDSVAAASAAAYRHGQYRPAELVAAWSRLDRRRGVVSTPAIEFNCYSWPRDYLVPSSYGPPDGADTWIRSAPDEPCETLYVDFARDAGFVTIDVTVGDHLLDADQAVALPSRLCGLLHALADGAECPVPQRSLTPPAAGWLRVRQGWVCVPRIEDVLRDHPGVRDVTVAPSEEHVVAHVRAAPGVTAEDLHRHVLDHLGEMPGVLAPSGYVLAGESHAVFPRIPPRPPATGAERALAAAVSAVCAVSAVGPDSVDMNRCLADHDVTAVAIPRLLALLRQSGFTGVDSDELAATASLGHLAAAMEPLPSRGETSP